MGGYLVKNALLCSTVCKGFLPFCVGIEMIRGVLFRLGVLVVRAFFVFSLLSSLALSSCRSPLPAQLEGYSPLAGGAYYRLWELGEGSETACPGDYITVQLRYATWEDSTFFEGGRRFMLEASRFKGSIDECFSSLSEGDSASFYINSVDFFTKTLATSLPDFLDSTLAMRVDVRMIEVVDSATFASEKEAFLHWIEDFREYEKVVLRQYLMRERISTQLTDSLFYLPISPGSGDYPRDGDTLTIEFEGRFLDGKYFDSTLKRGEAFQFVLGQKWQVIDGLERAVRMMRQGEHSIFILPSAVAFGEEGSSTGIVPPYTPVVFEVELVDLKPGER